MTTPIRLFFVPGELPWQEQAISFWTSHSALTDLQAQQRARFLSAIALNETGDVIGVATLIPTQIIELEQEMLLFRTFVAPQHRKQGIASRLLAFCFNEVASRIVEPLKFPYPGMAAVVPAEISDLVSRKLLWPDSGFFLAARRSNGEQLRVRYFEAVQLSAAQGHNRS